MRVLTSVFDHSPMVVEMIVTSPDSSQHCYPQLPESTTPGDAGGGREPALNIGVCVWCERTKEKVLSPTRSFLQCQCISAHVVLFCCRVRWHDSVMPCLR